MLGLLLCVACSKSVPASDTHAHQCSSAELELERALPIEGASGLEPSGLLMHQGKLLMVSDKHDGVVFELTLGADVAKASPFVTFAPPDAESGALDFEGLAHGAHGSFLLASEARYRVLQVAADGQSQWLTPSVREPGARAGLFRKPNAGLEGVTLREDSLLLAAEREPRGLLEAKSPFARWEAVAMPSAICPAPKPRSSDFADLSVEGARTFALVRNAHLVLELRKLDGVWREGAAFSYADTENASRFAYADRRFGLAEGLALDATHFYVALDNNGDRRANEPDDRRPLLFVFKR